MPSLWQPHPSGLFAVEISYEGYEYIFVVLEAFESFLLHQLDQLRKQTVEIYLIPLMWLEYK